MKTLFASCAVIALMAAPALAQSTYQPTDPFAAPEVEAEEVPAEEPMTAYEAERNAETQTVVDPVAGADVTADTEMVAETEPTADSEMSADAEPANDDEMIAETEAADDAQMVAGTEAVDAPIDAAELPQEYSTDDLNALMLAKLNDTAVEIAEMEFEGDTEAFAAAETSADTFADAAANPAPESDLAMTDPVSPQAAIAEDDAATDTYAAPETETAMTESVAPDGAAPEDYAAAPAESQVSTYAETDTAMSTEETAPEGAMTQDYAATETLPEDEAALADETTAAPEAYASVETGTKDNLAPPFDTAADLSDESATVMMSEQTDASALSAEGDIDQTTVEIASQDSRFSTLVELVGIAGLQDALSLEGPYTVFAPTNDAFAALPESTLARLKSEEGKAELAGILKAHVAVGAVLAGEVPLAGQAVETLADTSLNVTGSVDGSLNVEGSTTIGEGISASNGVVYAIDAVILPDASPETPALDTEG